MSTPATSPYKKRQHAPHPARWAWISTTRDKYSVRFAHTYRRAFPKAPSRRDRHRAAVAARKARP